MSTLSIGGFALKRFDISAKKVMNFYLKQLNYDLSDYTFTNNYIWTSQTTGFYSVINDTFCLFVLSGGQISMVLPPLGERSNVYETMVICFDLMDSHNTDKSYTRIDFVHEEILEGFVNYLETGTQIFDELKDYIIERKLVDYIYRTEDLIELKGDAYKTKRNEINKFRKAYPNYRLEVLDKEKHGADIIRLFNKWIKDRVTYMPKEEVDIFLDGIYAEKFAVKKLLRDYEKLDVIGLVIYIDDEIKGFTVGERINENTASVLIEKTDFEVLGCSQFLFREFAKLLKATYDTEFINVGDDMGFENLRKVKMSYRPYKLASKYTIYKR